MGLKEWSDRRKIIAKAKKVKGKPWWEANLKQFVWEYDKVDQLNDELGLARELGWFVESTTGTDGHINIGRTVSRAVLTGGIGPDVRGLPKQG